MPRLLLCLTLLFVATAAQAQVVEFDPPTQVELDPERLVITFFDRVSPEVATQFVDSLGYAIDSVSFHPITAFLVAGDSLSTSQREALQANKAVLGVEQINMGVRGEENLETLRAELKKHGETLPFPDLTETWADNAPIHIYLRLAPTLTDAEANAILGILDNARVEMVTRRPNELFIRVGVGEDAVAVALLESSPLVKYVAYAGVLRLIVFKKSSTSELV